MSLEIKAEEVAKVFRDTLKSKITSGKIEATLIGYLANSDPAAEKYAQWTERSCNQTGIKFKLVQVNREHLEDKILEANEDPTIHGIMVYYPVFGGGHDQYIQNCVSPYKDVEGLCHLYRFNMYHNVRTLDVDQTLKCIIPCTPLGIIKVLEHMRVYDVDEKPYGNQLHGKTVAIINRSEVVGRPLAALLANDGAKVYSIDLNDVLLFTKESKRGRHLVSECDLKLEQILPLSDVIISGVPSKEYKLEAHHLKAGAVGVNFSSFQNFSEEAIAKTGLFCGSVGKVTVTMLQRNLLRLRAYQLRHSSFPNRSNLNSE